MLPDANHLEEQNALALAIVPQSKNPILLFVLILSSNRQSIRRLIPRQVFYC